MKRLVPLRSIEIRLTLRRYVAMWGLILANAVGLVLVIWYATRCGA